MSMTAQKFNVWQPQLCGEGYWAIPFKTFFDENCKKIGQMCMKLMFPDSQHHHKGLGLEINAQKPNHFLLGGYQM